MSETRTLKMIQELKGQVCRCGADKNAGNTFCLKCYYSLPKPLRAALYQRVGEGYEQAYEEAVAYMLSRGRSLS